MPPLAGFLDAALLAVALPARQPLATWVALGSLVGAGIGVLVAVKTHVAPWVAVTLKRRSIVRHGGARLFTPEGIEDSSRYYIAPLFQAQDPAGDKDRRAPASARQQLFETLDVYLRHPGKRRFLMLLGDSGTGKTSALVNYYVRYLRRWRRPFDLAVVPLGDPRAEEVIGAIEDRGHTSLFLDALDEDPAAIRDLTGRLERIVDLTRDFRTVLIACRTQFFSSEQETPRRVGVMRFDPLPAGEEREYVFHKLYLSPLDDRQVSRYLRLRYPFRRRDRRRAAHELVERISDLSSRPMLLAYVDDILASGSPVNRLSEVYDAIVRAWLQREKAFVEPARLLEFSERLAVDLIAHRDRRGGEKIPKAELGRLAEQWQVPLTDWQLSSRSLLNRDAEGNYKFAHRSIMEYLFALRITKLDPACAQVEWTDQIRRFALEFLDNYARGERGRAIVLDELADRSFAKALLEQLEQVLPKGVTEAEQSIARALIVRKIQANPDDVKNLARVMALLSRYSVYYIQPTVLADDPHKTPQRVRSWMYATGGGVSSALLMEWTLDAKATSPDFQEGLKNLIRLMQGQIPLVLFPNRRAAGPYHEATQRAPPR